MALGYGGHADWTDMSEYLVHLTGSADALASIIHDRTLEARSAFGAVRNHERVAPTQQVVCFSEIPLDHLGRLAIKHGRYGLAFYKPELRAAGAVPVWYLERGTPIQRRMFELVREAAYRRIRTSTTSSGKFRAYHRLSGCLRPARVQVGVGTGVASTRRPPV